MTVLDYLSDVLNFRVMVTSALANSYIAFALVLVVIGIVAMLRKFPDSLRGTIILEIILRAMFELVMVFFSIQENIILLREEKEEQEDYRYDDDDYDD